MVDTYGNNLKAHPGALRWGAILFTIAAGLMLCCRGGGLSRWRDG